MHKLSLWEIGIKVLEKEIKNTNKNQVARALNVYPSTVGRWLKGDRGEHKPITKYLDSIFKTFSESFEGVLMENYDTEFAKLLIELKEKDKLEKAKQALKILGREDETSEKLENEIKYLDKQ